MSKLNDFDNAVRKKCRETTSRRRTALMEDAKTPEIRMKFGLAPSTEKTQQQVVPQSIGDPLPTMFGQRVYNLNGAPSSMSMFTSERSSESQSERGESDMISLSSFGSAARYWTMSGEPLFVPDDYDDRSRSEDDDDSDERLRIGAEDRLIATTPNLAAIEARYVDEGGVGMRRRTSLWAIDQSEYTAREFLRVPLSNLPVATLRGEDREMGRILEQSVPDDVAINHSQMGARI